MVLAITYCNINDCNYKQKLIVQTENGKSFMIFRFDDNHIQLMSFPVPQYIGIGWLKAYYDITDKSTKEKLLKLLDTHRKSDE